MSEDNSHEETLYVLNESLKSSKEDLVNGIILAHDVGGMTFREIGYTLNLAHSWVYKLYKRGKARRK